jgi:hypothetical protein
LPVSRCSSLVRRRSPLRPVHPKRPSRRKMD